MFFYLLSNCMIKNYINNSITEPIPDRIAQKAHQYSRVITYYWFSIFIWKCLKTGFKIVFMHDYSTHQFSVYDAIVIYCNNLGFVGFGFIAFGFLSFHIKYLL